MHLSGERRWHNVRGWAIWELCTFPSILLWPLNISKKYFWGKKIFIRSQLQSPFSYWWFSTHDRVEYLQQKPHSMKSLKYLLYLLPFRKKFVNLWHRLGNHTPLLPWYLGIILISSLKAYNFIKIKSYSSYCPPQKKMYMNLMKQVRR